MYYPILVIEMILSRFHTGRAIYVFALAGIYNIYATLYQAYYILGLIPFLIVAIAYTPYIKSLLRMMTLDTETARMIFYRNCCRIWAFALAIDIWINWSTIPVTAYLCSLFEN